MKTELSYLPPEAGLKAGQSHREADSFQETFIPERLKFLPRGGSSGGTRRILLDIEKVCFTVPSLINLSRNAILSPSGEVPELLVKPKSVIFMGKPPQMPVSPKRELGKHLQLSRTEQLAEMGA